MNAIAVFRCRRSTSRRRNVAFSTSNSRQLAQLALANLSMRPHAAFTQGTSFLGNSDLFTPGAYFTFTSFYALLPPLNQSCTNIPSTTPPFSSTSRCSPGTLPTGISCNNADCGRPTTWGDKEPFFLPIDLFDIKTWQLYGFGLPTARFLAGESSQYSLAELRHLEVNPSDFHYDT
jgi:hypothetical protein